MGKIYSRTPGTSVKFSLAKGAEYWRQRMKYTSLAFFELSEADRNYALDAALPLTTGKKAQEFVRKQHEKDKDCHWACKVLDWLANAMVLRYRGVDIRLLYKRTVIEHPINELEPVPAKPVIDDEDAWIYLDLVSGSARQTHAPTLQKMEALERELALAKSRIQSQDNLIIEMDRTAYHKAVADMKEDNESIKHLLAKVEEKQAKIPSWVLTLTKAMQRGNNVQENPALYNVARKICHQFGFPWTDPRSGKTYPVPKKGVITDVSNDDEEKITRKTKGKAGNGKDTSKRRGKAVKRPRSKR